MSDREEERILNINDKPEEEAAGAAGEVAAAEEVVAARGDAAARDTSDASLTDADETRIPVEEEEAPAEEAPAEETPASASDSASGVPTHGTAEGDGRESEEGRDNPEEGREGGGSEGDRTYEPGEVGVRREGDKPSVTPQEELDKLAADVNLTLGNANAAYNALIEKFKAAKKNVRLYRELYISGKYKNEREAVQNALKKANEDFFEAYKKLLKAEATLKDKHNSLVTSGVSLENSKKVLDSISAKVKEWEKTGYAFSNTEDVNKATNKVTKWLDRRGFWKGVKIGSNVILALAAASGATYAGLEYEGSTVPPEEDTPTYEFNAEAQDIKDIQKALENVFGNTSTKIESIKAYGVVGDEHHVYLDAVSKAGNCVVDVNLGTLEKDLHSTEELITFMQNNGVETEQVATYYPLAAMTGSESVVESVKGHINDLFGSVVDEVYAKAKISSGKAGTVGSYDFLLSSEQGDIASWDNGVVIRTKQTNPRAIQKIFNAAFGEKANEGFAARITVSKNAPKTLKPYAQSGIVLSLSNGESMTL